jgi:hypothetical protein
MISMNLIRRVLALTAATAMAPLVTFAGSACGGAPSATGPPTSGLERKSPADMLQKAAGALKAAKSVRIVGIFPDGVVNARVQRGSASGTLTKAGHKFRVTIIGRAAYINTDQTGLKMSGAPPAVQRHDAGRWLKVAKSGFTGFTFASLASQITAYRGPLEPKVRQATLDGRKVVVIGWRDGSKLYVANTGPAYPLRAELTKGPNVFRIDFTEYGARFNITAPRNAINVSRAS